MIVDRFENWTLYPFGEGWEKAFSFLMSLSPEIEAGEYPLQGDDIFARVMSYDTRDRSEAILEAHRRYVDIQAVINGRERMEWSALGDLAVVKAYEDSNDAEFYRHPDTPMGKIDMLPGFFAVFFPRDAHMPTLTIGDRPEWVKKVVIKIDLRLLQSQ